MAAHAAESLEALRSSRNRRRAEAEKHYLKSPREHLGCGMKVVDAEVRRIHRLELSRDELIALIESLWDTGVFECLMTAGKLANRLADRLAPNDLYIFEQMLREAGGWALVDTISMGVVGGIVERYPEDTGPLLDRWAKDPDFWIRRAAMLSLLKPLKRGEGDWSRFTRYADEMLEEKEFFIRKAIGWVLRETSKERPDLVERWVTPRLPRMSGVTRREATKYLPRPR